MQTLNQSYLDQLGQAVGAHQVRVEGPQLIKMQKPFTAFKKQLDLPANSVEFQYHVIAGDGFRQGGQDAEVACQAQRRGRRGSAFFSGIAAQALSVAVSRFGGQRTNHKPGSHRNLASQGDIYNRKYVLYAQAVLSSLP